MQDYRLMDGPSIPINLELADVIGLKESILLQQIHYWCCKNAEGNKTSKDGYPWVYNTYEEWTDQLPWKGPRTTERVVEKLVKQGLIITGNYSYGNKNRTTWYRINYDKLAEITLSFQTSKMNPPPQKNSGRSRQNGENNNVSLTRTINININSNSTEINGDLPLTESPTTAKSPVCENIENDNWTEGNDLDLFIDWYIFSYASTFGKNHPPLNADQRLRVITNLTNFLNDPDYAEVDGEGLQAMVKDFFYTVKSNDWHIFHFVDPEILKYRFYNVYHQGHEY